jgi:hypothetical protein
MAGADCRFDVVAVVVGGAEKICLSVLWFAVTVLSIAALLWFEALLCVVAFCVVRLCSGVGVAVAGTDCCCSVDAA